MPLKNTAILLVNLGTPDAPEEDAIRRYLRQFLSDPRVVDLPRWLWLPILHLIILKVRPPKLVEKYQLVWGTFDGPIRNITKALSNRLSLLMGGTKVLTAMSYGEPSVSSALQQVGDVDQIIVIPLFPQFAGATTSAVNDELDRSLQAYPELVNKIIRVDEYHADPGYIDAIADSIARAKMYRDGKPHIVFSFHGIPVAQANRGDPYPMQCSASASLIAAALELPKDRWTLTFQSRFGPAPWLQPYTDKTMASLPEEGITDVLVVCPGFSVDCLETIEEIKLLNRQVFLDAGGKSFGYVKALNASARHAELLRDIVQKKTSSNNEPSEEA